MMFDIQTSPDCNFNKNSVLAGTRSDLIANIPVTYTAGTNYNLSAYQVNSGYRFQSDTNKLTNTFATHAAADVVTQTFCINLISLVGTLCADKYFPLFACTSAPLRVEIQLVSSGNAALCSSGACAFTLTNVEYVANMIELSDSAMSTILNQTNGAPLQFAVTDYKNFGSSGSSQTSITSTTQMSIPIPAKYSSLKSLFVAMRDSAKTSTATYFPHSTHKFNVNEYFFRIGSQVVPSKNPNNAQECFAELMKAIGSMSDLNQTPSIDLPSYILDFPSANNDVAASNGTTSSGSFYLGLDLENYSGADRSTIFAGWNSNTDDIYLNITFGLSTTSPNAAATSIKFDTYAMFDSVLVFENNTCYVKF